MNAANEVAVERFCAGEIEFGDIWRIVGSVMEKIPVVPQNSLDEILAVDAEARVQAAQWRK
jgi:1-deoxy-D-xylulose-5-phosphate reductoisomerase